MGFGLAIPSCPLSGVALTCASAARQCISDFAVQMEDLSDHGLSIQIARALLRYITQGAAQHTVSASLVSTVATIAHDARVRAGIASAAI